MYRERRQSGKTYFHKLLETYQTSEDLRNLIRKIISKITMIVIKTTCDILIKTGILQEFSAKFIMKLQSLTIYKYRLTNIFFVTTNY